MPGGEERPVFFCHIPKTAGTSVRLALEAHFQERGVFPSAEMMRIAGGTYPPLDQVIPVLNASSGPVKLLRGHYHWSAHLLLQRPITIVVLREPLARTISHIRFRVNRMGLTPERAYRELDEGRLPQPILDNTMTRYLAGQVILSERQTSLDQDTLWRDPITEPVTALREAIAAVNNATVLGLRERFDLLADDLREIGIFLPDAVHNAGGKALPLSDRQIETIRRHNLIDLDLYDNARRMVELRSQRANHTE